jgi:SAM-dependent methyltransferase
MDRATVSDTWERGNAYELYIGRWSRQVAPEFLAWLNMPAGRRWLDVGCGTGALSAAILDHCSPLSSAGVEPSKGFLEAAKHHLGDRVTLHQGNATSIPLADDSVDVTVSGLVLNFVQDPAAALREMQRVTASDGTIAAYVWDYAGRMEPIRFFWDAAVEIDPGSEKLDEGLRFPLCRPEALEALFTCAGLGDVAVNAIDIPTRFADFEDYWHPFLGGQGPAPAYVMSLDEEVRNRLRERLRERLEPNPEGEICLTARAWAVRGSVGAP